MMAAQYLGCVQILFRRRKLRGKPHAKVTAFADLALRFDAPAVNLRDVLHDREPQSRAPGFPMARLIDAVEAFKDALEVL